jgi:hypothetical protein
MTPRGPARGLFFCAAGLAYAKWVKGRQDRLDKNRVVGTWD